MVNQEKFRKHGKKPNVRYKPGSAKNAANITSQSVRRADKGLVQSQTLIHGGRALSLDRMPTAAKTAVTDDPSSSSSKMQTRSQTKSDSPFLSTNRFDVLSDDDVGDVVQVEPEKKQPRIRIPPIHIMGRSVADVTALLNANGIPRGDDYLLKYTPSSVQFITKSKEVFTKTQALLKSSDVQFFTYNTSENVPTKFVLSGLPAVDISELKSELEALKIMPTDVKVLSSSKSGADEHTLYLLYFNHGSVKLQDLRKTKSIDNVMVSWRYFTKRPNDAAQCHRCQRFGHGSTNCNLPPKCVKCGGKHLTDVCPLPRKIDLNNGNNSKSQLKCANCGASHTANFRGCPARQAYLEEVEKRKRKPNRPVPPSTTSSPPGFPRASSSRPPPATAGHRSYAHVSAQNGTANPSTNLPNDGSFTVTEFLSLARDMFTRLLTKCSKQQQFDALLDLLSKYMSNG